MLETNVLELSAELWAQGQEQVLRADLGGELVFGVQGTPGKDGVSCSHSWEGTVLTVISASGTSSADLKGERGSDGRDGADGHTPVKGTDYFTQQEQQDFRDQVFSDERYTYLKTAIADIIYVPIAITELVCDAGVREKGEVVDSITLAWGLNKPPSRQMLHVGGGSYVLGTQERGILLSNLGLDSDTTYQLRVYDEKINTAKTVTIPFRNGVYYGAAEAPETLDSEFLLSLTKELSSDSQRTLTLTAEAGQYIWYCVPADREGRSFRVNGLEGGFQWMEDLAFTNCHGYQTTYSVYRSTNAGLGTITVEVT